MMKPLSSSSLTELVSIIWSDDGPLAFGFWLATWPPAAHPRRHWGGRDHHRLGVAALQQGHLALDGIAGQEGEVVILPALAGHVHLAGHQAGTPAALPSTPCLSK
jgi:hypothetical protein